MAGRSPSPGVLLNGWSGWVVPALLGSLLSYAASMTAYGGRITALERDMVHHEQLATHSGAVPRVELENRLFVLTERIAQLERLHRREVDLDRAGIRASAPAKPDP